MKPTDYRRPWLTPRERMWFVVNCIVCAILVAIVFALTPGCSFVAEGEPLPGCDDCYSPPHFAGARITGDPPPSTDEGASSSTTDETDGPGSTSDQPTTDQPSTTGDADGNPTESDGGSDSSSTGEPAEYIPAHCDMTCPAGDAIQPTPEQSEGNFGGCYCATPCESDDDCDPFEQCDPLFDRCTVPCMSYIDCTPLGEEDMVCDLWWNDAEHYSHYCTYWNEDAP